LKLIKKPQRQGKSMWISRSPQQKKGFRGGRQNKEEENSKGPSTGANPEEGPSCNRVEIKRVR
jgi:hypothetical protein